MYSSDWQERTRLLLGKNIKKLEKSNILVFGLGGVGGIAAEMLCRSGIQKMTIVDGDSIHLSNLNRQIFTDKNVIGLSKANVVASRLKDINPLIELRVIDKYVRDEEMLDILQSDSFDYVVDAIDTVSPKVYLIYHSISLGYKLVSSMGAGGKINPSLVRVDDISKSYNCPLARIVRKRLHKLGIYRGFKVVFSPEKREASSLKFVNEDNKKTTLGTISYMPAMFGLYASWVVIDDLLKAGKF
jgi:tRNA A37 threonylcarbamoyladenosine dehydratase